MQQAVLRLEKNNENRDNNCRLQWTFLSTYAYYGAVLTNSLERKKPRLPIVQFFQKRAALAKSQNEVRRNPNVPHQEH